MRQFEFTIVTGFSKALVAEEQAIKQVVPFQRRVMNPPFRFEFQRETVPAVLFVPERYLPDIPAAPMGGLFAQVLLPQQVARNAVTEKIHEKEIRFLFFQPGVTAQ